MRAAARMRARIRLVLAKDFNGNVSAFARAIDAPRTRINTWCTDKEFRGDKSLPASEYIRRICEASGRSAHWLVTGEGPEYAGDLAPLEDLGLALREHLIGAAVRSGTWLTRPFVEALFPSGAAATEWAASAFADRASARARACQVAAGAIVAAAVAHMPEREANELRAPGFELQRLLLDPNEASLRALVSIAEHFGWEYEVTAWDVLAVQNTAVEALGAQLRAVLHDCGLLA